MIQPYPKVCCARSKVNLFVCVFRFATNHNDTSQGLLLGLSTRLVP